MHNLLERIPHVTSYYKIYDKVFKTQYLYVIFARFFHEMFYCIKYSNFSSHRTKKAKPKSTYLYTLISVLFYKNISIRWGLFIDIFLIT